MVVDLELDEFVEKLKSPDGRVEIAKEMCDDLGVLKYDKTLESIHYLALPLLLMFDEENKCDDCGGTKYKLTDRNGVVACVNCGKEKM